jgi:uncharacterized phage protein (TIGR02218 family)
MKTIGADLLAHLQGETTTLCTLWKLTRRDGVAMGFTDFDQDVTFDGLTYVAATGYTRSAISANSTLAVDNVDLEGILASGALTSTDIRKGLYDWAELRISLVNYTDLSQGSVLLRRGTLGEFTLRAGAYITELRGLSQYLSRNFVEAFTSDCRATLGDARCKVNMAAHTETGDVGTVTTQRRVFTAAITGSRPAGYFDGGLLTWTGGANTGASQEVKTVASGIVTLYLPTGEDIAGPDTFTIKAGCDKSYSTCYAKFNNIANNRSFPFIPGADVVNVTPNAKPQ